MQAAVIQSHVVCHFCLSGLFLLSATSNYYLSRHVDQMRPTRKGVGEWSGGVFLSLQLSPSSA